MKLRHLFLRSRSPQRQSLMRRYAIAGALAAVTLCGALAAITWPRPVAPEPDYWGADLPQPAATAHPLLTRAGCRVTRWGTHPWGDPSAADWEPATRAALATRHWPPHVIDEAIRRLRAVTPDGFAHVASTHGAVGGRYYYPTFDTTYRRKDGTRVVCRDSMHTGAEPTMALHYDVAPGFPLWLILACGNVTVPHAAPPGWIPPSAAVARPVRQGWVWPEWLPWGAPEPRVVPPGPVTAHPGPGLPPHAYVPLPPTQPGHPQPQPVDEPGTIWLALAAMAGVVWLRRKK